MEPLDPLSQLASCCFGRRRGPSADGFKTQALRNQYYYSPSMAHIGPGNTTTWPMGLPFGASPGFALAGPQQPAMAQPYILYTQPVIIAAPPPAGVDGNNQNHLMNAQSTQSGGSTTMALVTQHTRKSPSGHLQAISFVGGQPVSPLAHHKLQSLIGPSQYAIYSNSLNSAAQASLHTLQTSSSVEHTQSIYENPRGAAGNRLVRNRSNFLGPIAELSYMAPGQQLASPQHQRVEQLDRKLLVNQQQQLRPRSLNSEIYRRLELIEKQVDLTRDMDLVERHGIVITRAIEAHTLAPHLTEETLLNYQRRFLLNSDEYVIRFIEIIKRPGQTLGLYIRLVHFEQQITRAVREGIVITKIESSSPVYTSQVLHVGDEILSINLIDIQQMSLDDVVTLMSIPKRLVLALRIPKERDPMGATQQMRASSFSYPSEGPQQQQQQQQPQHQQQLDSNSKNHPDEFQDVAQARLAQLQMTNQESPSQRANSMANRPLSLGNTLNSPSAPPFRPASQSASQSNFWEGPNGTLGIGQECQTAFDPSNIMSGQLSRPARVRSAVDMSNMAHDFEGNLVGMQETMTLVGGGREQMLSGRFNQIPLNEHRSTRQVLVQNSPQGSTGVDLNSASGQRELQQIPRTPPSSTMNQLERQLATTLSIDDQRDESDRFRNFSVDPEIATLEREAMNKERHIGVEVLSNHQRLSNSDNVAESLDDGLFGQFSNQLPISAPSTNTTRRTLPTRPDLSSSTPPRSVDANGQQPGPRRPVLSSIRLGETPEQSSYFSSSIDAINRELKELRQQRMAISNNDPIR